MADAAQNPDDAIVELIRSRNEAGMELLLTQYGRRVKGYLTKRFGVTLMPQDIDAALSDAMLRVWSHIESFDFSKGSLWSWTARIAHHAAIDIINEQKRHPSAKCDIDQLSASDEEPRHDSPESRQQVADLEYVIENMLEGLQQAIIRADLLSDDVASADVLARVHGTTKNSIYVSRQKARANIKKHMEHLAEQRARGT